MRFAHLLLLACLLPTVGILRAEDLPFQCTVNVEKAPRNAEAEKPVHHQLWIDNDRTRSFSLHVSNSTAADIAGVTAKIYVIGHMLFPNSQTQKPLPNDENVLRFWEFDTYHNLDCNYRAMAILTPKPFTIPASDAVDIDAGSVPFHVHVYNKDNPIYYHGEDYDGWVIQFSLNGLPIGSLSSSTDTQLYTDALIKADKEGPKRENYD